MAESFDPYHRWLGIPPKHQPPDYYRLLGIEQFEEDREVIRDGADRQMAHVRTYQLGECSALSQKILNELAAARACLLNSERKAAYDAKLREQLAGQAVIAPPEPSQSPIPPPVLIAPEAVAPSLEPGAISEIGTGAVVTPTTKRYRPPALVLTAGAAAALVLLGALIWSLSGAGDPQTIDSDSQPAGTAPPLAVAPFDAKQAARHQQAWAKYLSVPVEKANSIGMEFVLIPPGEFMMGSTEEEVEQLLKEAKERQESQWYIDRLPSEAPRHRVRITRPFYLGLYEVTQAEYQEVMGVNPSAFSGEGKHAARVVGLDTSRHPVEMVSWAEAKAFCEKLSAMPEEQTAGRVYVLPTEAQWEYACRAGTITKWSYGQDEAVLRDYAWYLTNSGGRTHAVGEKKPNAFGLFDMHGNVWERCADRYGNDYYAVSSVDDPQGPSSGLNRVFRGGGWYGCARICRSALRYGPTPEFRYDFLGFRLALVPADESSK